MFHLVSLQQSWNFQINLRKGSEVQSSVISSQKVLPLHLLCTIEEYLLGWPPLKETDVGSVRWLKKLESNGKGF